MEDAVKKTLERIGYAIFVLLGIVYIPVAGYLIYWRGWHPEVALPVTTLVVFVIPVGPFLLARHLISKRKSPVRDSETA